MQPGALPVSAALQLLLRALVCNQKVGLQKPVSNVLPHAHCACSTHYRRQLSNCYVCAASMCAKSLSPVLSSRASTTTACCGLCAAFSPMHASSVSLQASAFEVQTLVNSPPMRTNASSKERMSCREAELEDIAEDDLPKAWDWRSALMLPQQFVMHL